MKWRLFGVWCVLNEIDLVQQAISEKVALIVYSLCSFTTGFVLAYVQNWRLALAMSFIFPCLGVAGGFMNKYVSKYMEWVFLRLLCKLLH